MRDTGFLAKRKASLGEYSGSDESIASAVGATTLTAIRSRDTTPNPPCLLLKNRVAICLLLKELLELLDSALDLTAGWPRKSVSAEAPPLPCTQPPANKPTYCGAMCGNSTAAGTSTMWVPSA